MSKKITVFLLLTLVAASAPAAPPQAIALHARRLLDVRSGTVSEAYIVLRGDRIEAVAKSAPAEAKVIDLGDATVLPGLIDCHVHLLLDWTDFSATSSLRLSAQWPNKGGARCAPLPVEAHACAHQSPNDTPTLRAVCTSSPCGSTHF